MSELLSNRTDHWLDVYTAANVPWDRRVEYILGQVAADTSLGGGGGPYELIGAGETAAVFGREYELDQTAGRPHIVKIALPDRFLLPGSELSAGSALVPPNELVAHEASVYYALRETADNQRPEMAILSELLPQIYASHEDYGINSPSFVVLQKRPGTVLTSWEFRQLPAAEQEVAVERVGRFVAALALRFDRDNYLVCQSLRHFDVEKHPVLHRYALDAPNPARYKSEIFQHLVSMDGPTEQLIGCDSPAFAEYWRLVREAAVGLDLLTFTDPCIFAHSDLRLGNMLFTDSHTLGTVLDLDAFSQGLHYSLRYIPDMGPDAVDRIFEVLVDTWKEYGESSSTTGPWVEFGTYPKFSKEAVLLWHKIYRLSMVAGSFALAGKTDIGLRLIDDLALAWPDVDPAGLRADFLRRHEALGG